MHVCMYPQCIYYRWLRVECIYVLSGIGGTVCSGIFDPTHVSVSQYSALLGAPATPVPTSQAVSPTPSLSLQVGGSGALFGLLGVLLVELLQGWKWVKKPCAELVKIIITVIILLGEYPANERVVNCIPMLRRQAARLFSLEVRAQLVSLIAMVTVGDCS